MSKSVRTCRMKYLIKLRDQTYVKRYGFLSFAKNMSENLSSKYGQKLLDTTKKLALVVCFYHSM